MVWFNLPVDRLKTFRIEVSTTNSRRALFADLLWKTFGLGETRRIFGPPVTGNIVRITNRKYYDVNYKRSLTLCEVKVYGDVPEVYGDVSKVSPDSFKADIGNIWHIEIV